MALISTQPITDNFGNTYPNAYGLINQCNGNKKDKQQMFVLEIYRSQSDINNRPFMQDIFYSIRKLRRCTLQVCF